MAQIKTSEPLLFRFDSAGGTAVTVSSGIQESTPDTNLP